MTDLATTRAIGRYDVAEVLGRGGAAVVYLARQPELDRLVALKELAPAQAADPVFAARFLEEARLAGGLSHPNIVTVHEYFEHSGAPFIAMEYLERGSLRPYVGRLDIAQVAGVLEGVLSGLAHAERRGIVHRDLKPENLLVSDDGRVKIGDFGIARAYNQAATRAVVTATGMTVGTPAYMAPEQALGKDVDPRTDLYSLGIVAYELLGGRPPFAEADSPVAVLFRHIHDPVPPLAEVAPDVPPVLSDWVSWLLAKAPDDRPAGPEAAWERLEEIVIDLAGPRWGRAARISGLEADGRHERPLTPAPFRAPARTAPAPTAARPRTPRRAAVAVAVAGLAATAAGALAAGGHHSPPTRTRSVERVADTRFATAVSADLRRLTAARGRGLTALAAATDPR